MDKTLLIKAVDELCSAGTVEDATLGPFRRTWSEEQQLEILALCGNYHTICYVANAARLDRESFGATFPRE